MLNSIRSRLLFTYFLLIAAILGVVTLALIVFLIRNPRLAREAEVNLTSAANALQRQPLEGAESRDSATLAGAAERADQLLNARVALFDPNGTLLADSRADTEAALPTLVGQHRSLGLPVIAEFTDSAGKTWIYTSREVRGRFVLVVANQRPRAPFVSLFTDEFFVPIIRSGFLALLLSIILAFFMTRWITSPLQHVSAAARELASGKMREVTPEGPDEVQSLALTFNEMGRKVQSGQQSQRDFVANVSHELRTPLTSIQGYSQAILDGTAKGEDAVKHAAQVISDEADRMQRLVNELLELARLDVSELKLEKQSVALGLLLGNVIEKLRPQAQDADIELQFDLINLPEIEGDYDRLVQVFTNLIDNAIQHAKSKVEITFGQEKSFIKTAVSDDGPGIPAAEAKRVFERFYQLDKSRRTTQGRGTGLGLSIAQQIVLAHKGKIDLESQASKGSSFIVRLPRGVQKK